jgi:hypothetical protein
MKLHDLKSVEAMPGLQQIQEVTKYENNKEWKLEESTKNIILGNAKFCANVDLFKSSFYLKVAVSMVKTEEEGFLPLSFNMMKVVHDNKSILDPF